MSRVIAVAACGVLLSACSSSWVPSMPDMSVPGFSDWSLKTTAGPQAVTVNVESDPPGAEVRSSSGGTCRTPCTLATQAGGDFTVNVALNGYVTQSVPVRIIPPEDPRFGPEEGASPMPRVDPNPIFVELERAPAPPPPARKKPPPKKRAAAPKPAPAPETTMTAAPPPPMQPAPTAPAPWPMPR